jgi:deoxyribonuclease-4
VLIGAHVSIAGGLDKAVERGVEYGCDSIQIFHQSSRMWRPNRYDDEAVAAYRQAIEASRIEACVIHAVYLINCASLDKEIRAKSLTALKNALTLGDRIGALGVVLHPGAQAGQDYEKCMQAVGEGLKESLAETDTCPILLEDTAGAGGTLGRDVSELARLVEMTGDDARIGLCLDSCHLLASGFEVREPETLSELVDEIDAKIGLERLRCLHVNDSKMPLGSNRDRHASLGHGELGKAGLRVFLSEPRFEGLPTILETPGPDGEWPQELKLARQLRREGARNRARRSAK